MYLKKYQPTDIKIPCANDNINNIHDIPCASKYGNITLSKSNQQKSGIDPILISNQQNVTTPTHQPTRTASDIMNNLLTTKVSSMGELLYNALKMEKLLANPAKTDIIHPICTPDNETLLSVMISSMIQIVTDTSTSTSPSFQSNGCTTDVIDTTTNVAEPSLNEINSTLDGPYWSTEAVEIKTDYMYLPLYYHMNVFNLGACRSKYEL